MNVVPLQAVPNQTLFITLNGQNCQLNVYQKDNFGLFMDVYTQSGANLIIAGVLCQYGRFIVISAYLGFIGDFVFIDNLGTSDPVYTGLGSQYTLIYLEPSDIPPTSLAAIQGET
jgi:hypothetical protein